MSKFAPRFLALAGLFLYGAAGAGAQDWASVEALNKVDFTGLSPAQKATVLKLLRQHDCSCGCGMKLAECRVKDPNCYYSRGMAGVIVDAIKSGKSEKDALAEATASKFGHAPEHKILEDPVEIPTAGSPVIGPTDAPVTLVEFSDFQCPYCYLATPQLHAVLQAYPTQVKLIFKQFPLDIHSQAALAASAALAAHKQGKFWPMHDTLFTNHSNLSRPTILAIAAKVGLDMKRFEADLDSPEIHKAVQRDMDDGFKAGVMATPTIFIDGQHYNGAIKLETLKPLLDAELKHPARPAKTTASAASHAR
ncbi:MAG: thioredoxin domain-containing protein [Bryobacteraceae bacterium]